MPQLENLHAAMKTQCNNINNNKKGMKKKRSQVGSTGSTRFLLLFPSCAFPSVKPNEGASKGLTCKGWVFSTGLRLLASPKATNERERERRTDRARKSDPDEATMSFIAQSYEGHTTISAIFY